MCIAVVLTWSQNGSPYKMKVFAMYVQPCLDNKSPFFFNNPIQVS